MPHKEEGSRKYYAGLDCKVGVLTNRGPDSPGRKVEGVESQSRHPGSPRGCSPPSWGCCSRGKRGGACAESAEGEAGFCKNPCEVSTPACVDRVGRGWGGEPGTGAHNVCALRVHLSAPVTQPGGGGLELSGGLLSPPHRGVSACGKPRLAPVITPRAMRQLSLRWVCRRLLVGTCSPSVCLSAGRALVSAVRLQGLVSSLASDSKCDGWGGSRGKAWQEGAPSMAWPAGLFTAQ